MMLRKVMDQMTDDRLPLLPTLLHWLRPAVPPAITDGLRLAQMQSVASQVPVLLLVAGLNTLILIAVCAQAGLPFSTYGWLGLLLLYSGVRSIHFRRQVARAVTPAGQDRLLRTITLASLAIITLLGLVSAATYITGSFGRSLLVPMSLGFGSISIAHCLYRLRSVALGVISLGIVPSAAALILFGNFEAMMLGLSITSVGLLMIRFVLAQYDQLIDNLLLEQRIRTLANSDALTGLANRRAIEDFAAAQTSLAGMAVALIDLDGFKKVNDRHGHDVGDALLCIVANRLCAAAPPRSMVGRLGGDEFIVVLSGVPDDRALGGIATGLLGALCRPADHGDLRLPVSASVGYALGRAGDETLSAITKRADIALYAVKGNQPQTKGRVIAA